MLEGFTPETFDFLWGIRMNNNRDWFLAHKQQYQNALYEPMKRLGQDLFAPYAQEPGMILKVSRIYRDARLHHPQPYKEGLWLSIRHAGEDWTTAPCLFFDICPEGASYGFGVWRLSTSTMERFRRELAAKPEEFLELIARTESDTGCSVTADSYKRPKPCEDSRLLPFYAWRGNICCARDIGPGPELFGPGLEQRVARMFSQLMPLYAFFQRYCEE